MTVALVVAAARIPFSSDTLRSRVVAALSDRLDSEVELDTLTWQLFPGVHAAGAGLRIHHKGRRDVPPLIAVDSFVVSASLTGLWRRRVDHVVLKGLDIQVPPDDDNDEKDAATDEQEKKATPLDPAHVDEAANASNSVFDAKAIAKQVVITELEAPEARLVILRGNPDKPPRTWYLHTLTMQELGIDRPMPFQSVLTNGVPPGQIETSGSFGPWNRDEPGQTPLDGRFTFENADLSVFKGISGILSSKGTFAGALERIVVDGHTDTPDFMINISGHTVPLTTTYHAIVDGTNGNTTLDPVNATFVETSLVARGGVYEAEGVDGRIVRLDVTMESGRLEDLMRLAVKTPKPPMAGRLHLVTTMTLPPGKVDVVEKLKLDGRFRIEGGRFTDPVVQGRINELSRRASGKVDEMAVAQRVTSDFRGQFRMGGGRLAIPRVTFDVPGAIVQMGGGYGMREETIAFNGELYMDAKISETVTGFKSLLLKLADPIFRQDGRTVIPLKVSGTRNDPQFGLDMKRVFRRGDSKAAPPARKPTAKPRASASVTPQR